MGRRAFPGGDIVLSGRLSGSAHAFAPIQGVADIQLQSGCGTYCKAFATTPSPIRTFESILPMPSTLALVIKFSFLLVGFSTTATSAALPSAEPAAQSAAATRAATYPPKTCVVSGGKLGGMGKPVQYTHKQAGQPDRTVIFCCRSCIRKFEKEPSKFLAQLDAAASAAHAAN